MPLLILYLGLDKNDSIVDFGLQISVLCIAALKSSIETVDNERFRKDFIMITVEYEADGKYKVSSQFEDMEKAEKYAGEIRKLKFYAGMKFVIKESGKVVKEM